MDMWDFRMFLRECIKLGQYEELVKILREENIIQSEERAQGEWTIIDDTVCECPRCKHQQTFLLSPRESNVNFCEKCGTDMRKGSKNETDN